LPLDTCFSRCAPRCAGLMGEKNTTSGCDVNNQKLQCDAADIAAVRQVNQRGRRSDLVDLGIEGGHFAAKIGNGIVQLGALSL
jgi:hypothetical protein